MFDAQQCLLLAGVVIVVKQLTWTLSSSASDEGKIYLFETFDARSNAYSLTQL